MIANPIHEQLKKQDESLDILEKSVDRLQIMSKSINEELKEQDKMIDNLSCEVDKDNSKISYIIGKFPALLKNKNSYLIIFILLLTLFILILLIIYT